MSTPEENKRNPDQEAEKKSNPAALWMGLGLPMGIALGAAMGAATENMGTWVAIGVALGAAVGGVGAALQKPKSGRSGRDEKIGGE